MVVDDSMLGVLDRERREVRSLLVDELDELIEDTEERGRLGVKGAGRPVFRLPGVLGTTIAIQDL